MHVLLVTKALKDKAVAHFVKELESATRQKNKWTKYAENVDTPEGSREQVHLHDDE